MKAQGVSKYLSAVNAFFNIMDTRSARKAGKRKIFVATDDQSVIQEVKEILFKIGMLINLALLNPVLQHCHVLESQHEL